MSGLALAAARSALRAGRVGLPWNVQADLFVAGGSTALDPLGLMLVHEVRTLVGLDVEEVFAYPASDRAWVLCLRHARRLTSTLAFGWTPDLPAGRRDTAGTATAGAAADVHRFRVSGSHGTLLVDGTAPGVRVHSTAAPRRTWVALAPPSPALDEPDGADRATAQAVLDAAHRSSRDGVPVPVDAIPLEES